MPEMTLENLSPLARGLFSYMSGLDYEGLNWDEKEALEELRPVVELERRLEAAKRDTRRLDFLESEVQREMLTPKNAGGFASLFRRNILITRLRVDEAMAEVEASHDALEPPAPEVKP